MTDQWKVNWIAQQDWYQDAIRVCEAYLSLPSRSVGQDKLHFEHHLGKLLLKREEQERLKGRH